MPSTAIEGSPRDPKTKGGYCVWAYGGVGVLRGRQRGLGVEEPSRRYGMGMAGPWLLLSGCVEAVEALSRSLYAGMVKPSGCHASACPWVGSILVLRYG